MGIKQCNGMGLGIIIEPQNEQIVQVTVDEELLVPDRIHSDFELTPSE
jgi:hypothetical protein